MFRTPPEKRLGATEEEWTGEMQLLALLIELVSIKVAGKQIKKPIDIPRPGKKGKGGQQERGMRRHPDDPGNQPQQQVRQQPQPPSRQPPASSRDAAFKQGISVLQRTSKVRRG